MVPVPRNDRHLRLPEFGQRLREEEPHDGDEHQGLAEKADTRLVQLRDVDLGPEIFGPEWLRLAGGGAGELQGLADEAAADLETERFRRFGRSGDDMYGTRSESGRYVEIEIDAEIIRREIIAVVLEGSIRLGRGRRGLFVSICCFFKIWNAGSWNYVNGRNSA